MSSATTAGAATGRSQRIAKNTLVLFARMAVLTIVNLYAVRVVLASLGAEDYGIFNVVAGIVTCTVFVSGVLDLSIQRFYSVTIGEDNAARLREIFSISLVIVLALSAVVLVLFETAGLWFLRTHIVLPPERLAAATVCFQFALVTFLCSFVQLPYTAALFAHEAMDAYALISTAECLLKLLAAFAITWGVCDGLVAYSGGLCAVALLVLAAYAIYARRHYPECHYRHTRNHQLARSLLAFSGWSTLGTLAKMLMTQGSMVLLNVFFGPIANAAYGIALQINNAFGTLCNSMVLAIRPQMMQSYAGGDSDRLNKMFAISNKFIAFVLLAVSIPLITEMPVILSLWLGGDTVYPTLLFSRLIIIVVVLIGVSNPITIIMQATGHISGYHISVESVTMLSLPCAWLLFLLGMPCYYIFISMIGAMFFAHFVRLIYLRRHYSTFNLRAYFWEFALPTVLIAAAGISSAFVLHCNISNAFIRFAAVATIPVLLMAVLAFRCGMTKEERTLVNNIVATSKIRRLWTRH